MDFMILRMSINLGADNLTNCVEAGAWTPTQRRFLIKWFNNKLIKVHKVQYLSPLQCFITTSTWMARWAFWRQRPSLVQEKSQIALTRTWQRVQVKSDKRFVWNYVFRWFRVFRFISLTSHPDGRHCDESIGSVKCGECRWTWRFSH